MNVQTLRQIALENLSHDVSTINERTASFFAGTEGDLQLVRQEPGMREVAARLARPGGGRLDLTNLDDVNAELLGLIRTRKIYYRISVLDQQGEEVLGVESDDIADSATEFRVMQQGELSNGRGGFYRLLAENLADSQVTFAPAELSYRGNSFIPVVNFIVPLSHNMHRVGILVASVFAGNLFSVLEPRRNLGADEKLLLVRDDGQIIYDSAFRRNWNKLLAVRSEENLRKYYAETLCTRILSGKEGLIADGSDDIIAYSPLSSGYGKTGPTLASSFTQSLLIFESVPERTVMIPARAFATAFGELLVVFLGISIGLGLLATRRFTQPIAQIAKGADIISRGDYRHRLDVVTGDELELVARQFNLMAESLEVHEAEIAGHQAHLEETVAERTNQLAAEKAKLQAIIDNVSSAFLLLDPEFAIQTASKAFVTITGLSLDDVRGKDARSVFNAAGLCSLGTMGGEGAPANADGIPATHIDRRVNAAGVEQFIEHITVPLYEGTAITAILVIITDVTRRKRLEQQLIQSEKLMATGEMAAIIAHEFRNALTSVKMILQLRQESAGVSADDRRSTGVALDSIDHMESIVQELLNFARPSTLEFRAEHVGTLLDECLTFLQMRIKNRGITVVTELDDQLPQIWIDPQRFKEALVNLLLNAIQAIEGKGLPLKDEQIRIYSQRTKLTKTLRDFTPLDLDHLEAPSENRKSLEIVLSKGTECVIIGVSDTGPGMDRQVLQRIFDPFFTTKTNGTGLGLPMVKRTINAHGGVVIAKSTRGKGATFELILPIAPGRVHGEISDIASSIPKENRV